jgi:sulfate transport system permease protein
MAYLPFFRLERSILPGYRSALGFSLLYLTLLVFFPFSALILRAIELPIESYLETLSDPRTISALKLTFFTSFFASCINVIQGGILAWVLARYDFPGKKWIDALVDLPFALPTAVAGITLNALYAPEGWIGRFLEGIGVRVAYTPLGIIVALVFIGIPFIVRTLEPVLKDLDPEMEEAAISLGANRFQIFWRIIFPQILPAFLCGFTMAFARGLGEYGSVIFIAGNLPYKTEIASLLIMIRLEEYNFPAAITLALVMLISSFVLLSMLALLGRITGRRYGYEL